MCGGGGGESCKEFSRTSRRGGGGGGGWGRMRLSVREIMLLAAGHLLRLIGSIVSEAYCTLNVK